MASKELVTKVWIEDGCIVCDACETAAPTVFEVLDDTCIIRPAALDIAFNKPLTLEIQDAAEECPVDVIKFDTVTEEVPDDQAGEAAPKEKEATAVSESQEVAAKSAPVEPTSKTVAETQAKAAAKSPTKKKADPSIAALLENAKSRGGAAGIRKKNDEVPASVRSMSQKDPSKLPPDARQAKVQEAARKAKNDPDAQRRTILSGAALTIGWVAFGTGVGIAAGPAFARFMMPNVLEEPDPQVRVGKLQKYVEMAPGDVNEDFKPQGIWMIRDGNRLVALSIICTHLGCIPNWLPNDRKFKCPCHGSGYRPDGINFEGPTPRPLERFRLFVDGGIVVVDKSKKYQYELGQWDQLGSFLEV